MNYTKGEWKATDTNRIVIEHKEDFIPSPQEPIFVVAQCGIYNTVPSYDEEQANAHLISAAPRLYEELSLADEQICWLCKRVNPQHENCTSCGEREQRLKTLAKAEGREESNEHC